MTKRVGRSTQGQWSEGLFATCHRSQVCHAESFDARCIVEEGDCLLTWWRRARRQAYFIKAALLLANMTMTPYFCPGRLSGLEARRRHSDHWGGLDIQGSTLGPPVPGPRNALCGADEPRSLRFRRRGVLGQDLYQG
eukprot:1849919-Rhodomonas_salina.1